MSYADIENSGSLGNPVELYLFQSGADAWRLTSADTAITDDGDEYEPIGMLRESTGQNSELSGGAMKVTIPVSHEIAQRFIPFAPASPLSLTVYRKHVGVDDRVTIFVGRVQKGSNDGADCELTCEPDSALLKSRIPPQRFQRQCNWILYEPACGIDPEDFKIEATVTSIDGTTLVSADFESEADQWLRNGYIEIGEQRRMVLDHQDDTVIILAPFVDVEAPVAANAFAGCDRTLADCRDKFDNLAKFMGFPWIPGRNPFEGIE